MMTNSGNGLKGFVETWLQRRSAARVSVTRTRSSEMRLQHFSAPLREG